MTIQITIGVLYSCEECGLHQVSAAVPAREAEDLAYWLEQIVIPILIKHHDHLSPVCRTEALSELLVPTKGVDRLGGAARN